MRLVGKVSGDLGQVGGNVVDLAFECRFSHGTADEKQLQGKSSQEPGVVHIIGKGPGKHLVDHDVLHVQVFHHGPDQVLGFTASGTDEHPASIFDFGYGGFRVYHLVRTSLFHIHPTPPILAYSPLSNLGSELLPIRQLAIERGHSIVNPSDSQADSCGRATRIHDHVNPVVQPATSNGPDQCGNRAGKKNHRMGKTVDRVDAGS